MNDGLRRLMDELAAAYGPTLDVGCGLCDADAGDVCRTEYGSIAPEPHRVRSRVCAAPTSDHSNVIQLRRKEGS